MLERERERGSVLDPFFFFKKFFNLEVEDHWIRHSKISISEFGGSIGFFYLFFFYHLLFDGC